MQNPFPPPPLTALPAGSGMSLQDLCNFVENANVGMQAIDADGVVQWANAAQLAMLGYARDEYVGRSIDEFHVDGAATAATLERLRRGESVGDWATQMWCKDGTVKDVLVHSTGLHRKGSLIHSLTLDATDRQRADATQALLAAIVTASDDAIVSKSLDGIIRSWNRGAERLYGYTAEEVIGQPIDIIVPKEVRGEERAILQRLGRGERIDHFETVRVAKSGRRINVSLTISPICDHGRIVGASKVARDISHRKETERALLESERRYRAIVESQSEMVCRFRPDGTILFVNGAYARSRGMAPDAVLGTSFWDFIAPEDRPSVEAALRSLTPSTPEVKVENRFQTAAGERWMLWTTRALLFDAEGRLLEAQSTGIDITDRKRAEHALREADRRKNEFLATLGHELRNPLAPIRNMLEVLERADDDPDLRHRARTTMARQLDVVVRLVDDLLDVSRITRGKLQLRKERVALAPIVERALESVRYLLDEARHELIVRLPENSIALHADPIRVEQVLTNLLSNAAKYTPDGGRIELAAELQRGGVRITVRDTGVGIPPDQLEAVFEMFGQLDHSLDRGHKGLGIGLSLVRWLVELHGGKVTARSGGPGQGSEFAVWLPAEAARATPEQAPATVADAAPVLGQRRVLVVDDNRDAADSLAMLLTMFGHEIKVAFDGMEALQAAEEFRPDVVLLDIGLPKLDGHAVARRIREQPWGRRPLIAAVTGWGQESDRIASRAAGCDVHLTKPLTLAKLQEVLRSPTHT